MSESAQMERFLRARTRAGELDSEGSITVSIEQALRKLSEFQLPHPGDWALKTIQAAVAGGTAERIKVTQKREFSEFNFACPSHWTNKTITEAFFNPVPSEEDALNHLKSALWGVGIQEGRPFELALPGESKALVWAGADFDLQTLKAPAKSLWFTVSNQKYIEDIGYFARRKAARARNAEVSEALSRKAYCSPVPLLLDGRRLDALQYCPLHGYGVFSHPLVIGGVEAELPDFPIPVGTFENLKQETWLRHKSLQNLSERATHQLGAERAGVVYMLSLHIGQEPRGKSRHWATRPTNSRIYWACDGVVTHQENLPLAESNVSLAMFCNAKGLETDLTTMSLRQTADRFARYHAATRAITPELQKKREFSLADLVKSAATEDRVAGGVLLLFGTVALAAPPVGLLMLWAGYSVYQGAGDGVQEIVDEGFSDLESLQKEWAERFTSEA